MKNQTLELFLIALVIVINYVSCQSEYKPLEKAKMPCMVIFEDTTNWKYPVMKVIDDDKKEFHFVSITYCKKYGVNDIIYETLNK